MNMSIPTIPRKSNERSKKVGVDIEPGLNQHRESDRYNVPYMLIEYENGNLDEYDTAHLFQMLINTGLAWTLQGSYGRTAMDLIKGGLCTYPGREADNG